MEVGTGPQADCQVKRAACCLLAKGLWSVEAGLYLQRGVVTGEWQGSVLNAVLLCRNGRLTGLKARILVRYWPCRGLLLFLFCLEGRKRGNGLHSQSVAMVPLLVGGCGVTGLRATFALRFRKFALVRRLLPVATHKADNFGSHLLGLWQIGGKLVRQNVSLWVGVRRLGAVCGSLRVWSHWG